ncbi:MAG: hypothetical protein ABSF90_23095 [Syntrophobacteraceae bacterium]|jgi:hypothetical protein
MIFDIRYPGAMKTAYPKYFKYKMHWSAQLCGAVGPPADMATAFGGGRWDRQPDLPLPSVAGGRAASGIATQTFGGGKGRIDLDAIPDLSMTRGGTHERLRATSRFPCQDEKCLSFMSKIRVENC